MATEEVELRVRIDQLKKELAKVPGITAREMDKMARAASREWKDVERAAEKAAKNSAREWSQKLRDVERIGDKVTGGLVGDFADVGSALSALGPTGGVAAGALLSIGAAAGGVVIGLVGVTRAAGDAIVRLEELGLADTITQEQRDQIERANAALDACRAVVDQFTVALGAEFGPAVAAAATDLAQLGLDALAAFQAFAQGRDILEELALWIASSFIQTLLAPITGIAQLIEWMGDLGEAVGLQNNALKQVGQGYDDLTRQLAMYATGLDGLDNATTDATAAEGEAAMMVDRIIAKRREATRATGEQVEEVKKSTQAHLEEAEAVQQVVVVMEQAAEVTGAVVTGTTADNIDHIVAKWRDVSQAVGAYLDALESVAGSIETLAEVSGERHQERLGQIREERKEILENYKQMDGMEKSRANMRLRVLDEEAAAEKKKMRTSFAMAKVAAIAQAVISGAQAALAMIPGLALAMGPAAGGAPLAAALIAGTATAAQIAVIRAQKFHTGRDAADEFPAMLARGEGVANNRAMSSPVFREQLAAANAGQTAAPGEVTAVLRLNDRDLRTLGSRMTAVGGRGLRADGRRIGTTSHYGR